MLLASAALGIASSSCSSTTVAVHYGPGPQRDAGIPDLSSSD